jgi:hypothetical protein
MAIIGRDPGLNRDFVRFPLRVGGVALALSEVLNESDVEGRGLAGVDYFQLGEGGVLRQRLAGFALQGHGHFSRGQRSLAGVFEQADEVKRFQI